jgi:hypothetical protein
MRSRLFLLAVLCVELAACRDAPAGPPRVTTVVVPPGAPGKQMTACADGTWSTATGPGVCAGHGGVRHG